MLNGTQQDPGQDIPLGRPDLTQTQFRAWMRTTFGDGRGGSMHWRDNPAAKPHIEARKAVRDKQWSAQLAKWQADRAAKRAVREAEKAQEALAFQGKVEAAKRAASPEEALRIIGVIN